MQLNIQGGTKKQQNIAEQISDWTIPRLLVPKLEDKLKLTITIQKKINSEDYAGMCIWQDRGVKPRELEIVISNNQESKTFISTIMHEMTHLSQYMTGRLKHKITDNKFYWDDSIVDIETTEYYDLPWENEALYNEVFMYHQWTSEQITKSGSKNVRKIIRSMDAATYNQLRL